MALHGRRRESARHRVHYLAAPVAAFVDALDRAGFGQVATELRHRTLAMRLRQDDFSEYYPETGESPPRAAPVFGWSAVVFIDFGFSAASPD